MVYSFFLLSMYVRLGLHLIVSLRLARDPCLVRTWVAYPLTVLLQWSNKTTLIDPLGTARCSASAFEVHSDLIAFILPYHLFHYSFPNYKRYIVTLDRGNFHFKFHIKTADGRLTFC